MKEWMLADKEIFPSAREGETVGEYSLESWLLGRYKMVAQAEACKIVGVIKKHIEDNGGHLDMFWFMRLCKDVGL